MNETHNPVRQRLRDVTQQGFTLVELLVAVVITSIGLLGIAKIQALAYSSTGTASYRSLAAIQASSLATAMRANRAYWAAGSAPTSFTINGTTITDSTLNNTTTPCLNTFCGPATLAAYDLHGWATTVNTLLPNPTTKVDCPTASPIICTIAISWSEKTVAINAQGTSMAPQTYYLQVEP